ncbi:hypothetical protein RQP46_007070 [Phenoliferia psychrophenolica]
MAYNHERYKVDTSFKVNEEAQAAQLPTFLTERQHANRKRGREIILDNIFNISRDCMSAVHLLKTTGGQAYEDIWSSMTRERREETMFAALQAVELIIPSQRFREEAPELTLEAMCGGRGEGFNQLLHHFFVEPKVGPDGQLVKPTEYPLESLLNQKHLYLTFFVQLVIQKMAGVKAELQIPKKTSSVITPPDVLARLRAKYTYISDEGVLTPKPEAFRDREFVDWGGQWYCEIKDCLKSEDDLARNEGTKMLLCAPCKSLKRATAYCSVACQKKDWKVHKATCGQPLTDTTDIPIFSSNSTHATPGHKIGALLSQQIKVHDNWVGLCVICMPDSAKVARDLHDEFRDLAFSTRDPKNIGWLFTSLTIYLQNILGGKNTQPEVKPLAAISPSEFMHQFISAFEIDEATFIAGLPTADDLIERRLPDIPGVLRDFTSGKYSVLTAKLLQQSQLRDRTPSAYWGILTSSVRNGPHDSIVTVCVPMDPLRAQREHTRSLAFSTGSIDAICELYHHIQLLTAGQWGQGPFKFTTPADFAGQFADAWGTTIAVLDKWLDVDQGVEQAEKTRKRLCA